HRKGRAVNRFLWIVAIIMLGCKIQVRDLEAELSSARYSRVLEANRHQLEIRYLPSKLQALRSQRLADTAYLDQSELASLGGRSVPSGLLFAMRISPLDTSEQLGITNDV